MKFGETLFQTKSLSLLSHKVCRLLSSAVLLRKFTNKEIKIHVYAKRQTWICTTWPSFPLNCRLLFITSTHASFIQKNCWTVFICLFSILRNSQLKSDVCQIPFYCQLFQYDGVQQESSCYFGHLTQMNLISFS